MTTNQELAVMGLDTKPRFELPAPELVRRGRGYVTLQRFTDKTASELRAEFKAVGKKGKALTLAINECLSGKTEVREILGVMWLQGAFQSGMTIDSATTGKNGATLKLIKIKTAAPVKDEAAALKTENDGLRAELAAIRKQLGLDV